MRNRSDTWISLVSGGDFNLETVARIYGASGDDVNGTIGEDENGPYKEYYTITAPKIKRELFNGALSIGNCLSGMLNFTVMTTDSIPRSARIMILGRPYSGETYAEWMSFGTFWLDTRKINDNLVDIEAYDAMKMGYQVYSDDSELMVWPKAIKVVVARIAEQMGIEIDARTVNYIIDSSIGEWQIVLKPRDEDTILNILEYIGGVLGGNWTITPENRLRFVPLIAAPNDTNFIVDAEYNRIKTDQGDYLIWGGSPESNVGLTEEDLVIGGKDSTYLLDNEGNKIKLDSESVLLWQTGYSSVIHVPVVIGQIITSDNFSISKVVMQNTDGKTYAYGDETGYVLTVENNPYATASICQQLYNNSNGLVYAPFEITKAVYDPAAELGDYIFVGDRVQSVLYSQNETLDVGYRIDASAPYEDELESEFPYKTAIQKLKYDVTTLQNDSSVTRTSIEQTQEQVTILAEETTPKSQIRSTFAIDPTNITLSAGVDQYGNPTGRITFNTGALIVNGNNFQLTEQGILTCYGANINGTLNTTQTDEDTGDTYSTRLENGLLRFLLNGSEECRIGITPTGDVGLHSDDLIALDASYVNASGEISGGAWVAVDSNGEIDLRGRQINVGDWDDIPVYGITGTISLEGVSIDIKNGLVVGYGYTT